MEKLDIIERLRGKVRVPVNDGAGLLDGKDFFERSFPASNAAMEAAHEIESLRAEINEAIEIIEALLGLELGSSERAMAFLDRRSHD